MKPPCSAAHFIDAAGRGHLPAGPNARIVSLVPSITELLFSLGLGEQVVGRTGFCIHPRDAVRDVPKVGGTKDVKLDALRSLNPTHVIVNIDENDRSTGREDRRLRATRHRDASECAGGQPRAISVAGWNFQRAAVRAEQLVAELQRELDACRSIAWLR